MDALFLFDPFRQLHHGLFHTSGVKETREIERLINQLSVLSQAREVDHEAKAEAKAKILLIQLLFKVHELEKTTMVELDKGNEGKYLYVEKIASYLQKYFKEIITIEDVSKGLNLSPSYVSHTFKESTGYANPDTPELEDYGDATLLGANGATFTFKVDWFTPDGLNT